jgi:hypothetical protein
MVLKEFSLDKLDESTTIELNSIANQVCEKWILSYELFLNSNDLLTNLDFNVLHPENILLERICKIQLASIKSKNNYIITTSDRYIYKSLIRNNIPCKKNDNIKLIKNFKSFLKKIRISLIILLDVFFSIIIYYSSKEIRKKISNKKIFLYDIFILKNSFISGDFKDRWYSGFDFTKVNFQSYYIPTILESPIKKIIHHFKSTYSNNRILIKDNFIKPLDHLAILYSFFNKRTLRNINFNIIDLDIQDIVLNEVKKSKYCISRYRSKKNSYFFKQLKNINCDLRVIEWNENQIIDKTFCYYFLKYFPNENIISVRPFSQSKHLLNMFITNYDIDNYLCSNRVYNTSKGMQAFVPIHLRKNKYLIPYNRRSKLDLESYIPIENNDILVVLPLDIERSNKIINHLRHLENNFNIKIRPHPSNYFYFKKNVTKDLIIINNDKEFNESIISSNLVISSSSSFVLEAIELKKKVIIIAGNGDLFKIPLLDQLDESSFKISLSIKQTNKFVNYFMNLHEEISHNTYSALMQEEGIINPNTFFDSCN